MRIAVNLDPDVRVIVDRERLAGETVDQVINRLIRSAHRPIERVPNLPLVPGELQLDIVDLSDVFARLEADDKP